MEFNRDACLQSLVNISATIKLMADESPALWSSQRNRWCKLDSEAVYDFTDTLDSALSANDFRHVLRWVEFNLESGPARRGRLLEVIRGTRKDLRNIEHGDPRDPFLWARESRSALVQAAEEEMRHTVEYLDGLVEKICDLPDEGSDRMTPSPDTYKVIHLIQKGKSNDEITQELAGTSVGNVKTIRNRLKNGKYQL